MAFAISAMMSCEIETSGNGDLDGFWHLVRVDTLSTGGMCDMSGRRVFWSVQVGILNATDYDRYHKGYLFHLTKRILLCIYLTHTRTTVQKVTSR